MAETPDNLWSNEGNEIDIDTEESISNLDSITPDMVAATKKYVQDLGRWERARQLQRERQVKAYIWQSRDTTIISFGPRSSVARNLATSSLTLSEDDMKLLALPHDFAAFVGDPACFDHSKKEKP